MEPNAGTEAGIRERTRRKWVESTDERRDCSVREQLIRKQPQAPPESTQHDVTSGNQTQQP